MVFIRLFITLFLIAAMWPALQAQPKGNYSRNMASPVFDPERGKEVLDTFRNQRLQGDFLFLFEMKSMPPRRGEGDVIIYQGKMWGRWLQGRLSSRFLIYPEIPSDDETARSVTIDLDNPTAFLAQNGNKTKIWKYAPKVSPDPYYLEGEALFGPLLPGLELSAFDLQMAFIFWPDYTYEGTSPSRRTVHRFLMRAPADLKQSNPELHSVRIYIESRFHALNKVEILNEAERPLKTLRVRKFKKIDDRYIVKEIDFFDEKTRRKTRFKVLDAEFDHGLPELFFEPEDLPNLPADMESR